MKTIHFPWIEKKGIVKHERQRDLIAWRKNFLFSIWFELLLCVLFMCMKLREIEWVVPKHKSKHSVYGIMLKYYALVLCCCFSSIIVLFSLPLVQVHFLSSMFRVWCMCIIVAAIFFKYEFMNSENIMVGFATFYQYLPIIMNTYKEKWNNWKERITNAEEKLVAIGLSATCAHCILKLINRHRQ